MIYMDYNATAPVRPEAIEAAMPFLRERFGNASSVHGPGRRARAAVDEARDSVAAFLGCQPSEVIFTSGGSEADNLAIKGVAVALRTKGNHIITTKVEHPAVLNSCRFLEENGFGVTWLDVDENGRIDNAQLENSINERTILISAMYANNETGVLFPIDEIGLIAQKHNVLFHSDAVQAAGKITINCKESNIDLLSISGHKFGAMPGIGVLVTRERASLIPLIHGGAQERNRRAGTENVSAIVSLGHICALGQKMIAQEVEGVRFLRDKLEASILATIPDVQINGAKATRLPNTSNISFAGISADSLLANLDLAGIAVSSGSACSSGSVRPSRVLLAMGVEPSFAQSAIRFSLGPENTEKEVEAVLQILTEIVRRLRKESL